MKKIIVIAIVAIAAIVGVIFVFTSGGGNNVVQPSNPNPVNNQPAVVIPPTNTPTINDTTPTQTPTATPTPTQTPNKILDTGTINDEGMSGKVKVTFTGPNFLSVDFTQLTNFPMLEVRGTITNNSGSDVSIKAVKFTAEGGPDQGSWVKPWNGYDYPDGYVIDSGASQEFSLSAQNLGSVKSIKIYTEGVTVLGAATNVQPTATPTQTPTATPTPTQTPTIQSGSWEKTVIAHGITVLVKYNETSSAKGRVQVWVEGNGLYIKNMVSQPIDFTISTRNNDYAYDRDRNYSLEAGETWDDGLLPSYTITEITMWVEVQ